MKKNLLFLGFVLLLLCNQTFAQQLEIEDTFEGTSKFDWNEYSDKLGSSIVKNDGLYLENKKSDSNYDLSLTYAELPFDVSMSFSVECILSVEKIDDEDFFGVYLDRNENLECVRFLFTEGVMKCQIVRGRSVQYEDDIRVKLKKGKTQTVVVKVEYTGERYLVTMNGMEVYKLKRHISEPIFGFLTSNQLIVRKMVVSQ